MSAISLSTAQQMLQDYLAAETAIVTGNQGYTIGSRTFRKADLKEIREGVAYWTMMVNRRTSGSGGIRMRVAVPL